MSDSEVVICCCVCLAKIAAAAQVGSDPDTIWCVDFDTSAHSFMLAQGESEQESEKEKKRRGNLLKDRWRFRFHVLYVPFVGCYFNYSSSAAFLVSSIILGRTLVGRNSERMRE